MRRGARLACEADRSSTRGSAKLHGLMRRSVSRSCLGAGCAYGLFGSLAPLPDLRPVGLASEARSTIALLAPWFHSCYTYLLIPDPWLVFS
jgi:hypothetical protein